MCGRYALWELRELAERFDVPPRPRAIDVLEERYNIAPTQFEPTVKEQDKRRQLELMRWGFLTPGMNFRDAFKYKTFNARSEEIFTKPMWKNAIRYSRCLVPANAFYEWVSVDDGKDPYLIKPKDQELFAFAGIYRVWKDAEGKDWPTFSIVTTRANKEMSKIHHRQPVILEPDNEGLWLDTTRTEPADIAGLMEPYRNGGLDIRRVSREVNNSRVDDKSLVLPLNSK